MNTIRKAAAVFGLAAVAATALFAAVPASAQIYYHFYHPFYQPYHHGLRIDQRREAARLDRQAAQASYNGNYRRAAELRRQAARLRTDARFGY